MTRLQKYWEDARTLPADAALAYRHEGVRGAWKALATRSVHRLARAGRLIVFAHPLDEDLPISLPDDVRITQASDADWPALGAIVARRELPRVRALLASGRCCLIAWRGDRPVGYAWVARGVGPDVVIWPLPFRFPADAAYLWNLYVVPAERANGIGSALARARLRIARERGCREGWRMVAPSNAASLKTVRKSASRTRRVGEVRFVQLLNRTYCWFTPHPAFAARD